MKKEEEEVEDVKIESKKSSSKRVSPGVPVSDSALIALQKANGSWVLDDIIGMLSLEEDKVTSSNPCSDITLWATAIALTYLEKHFSTTRDLWQMVAKKATVFLKKGCKTSGIEFDAIIQSANQFLS